MGPSLRRCCCAVALCLVAAGCADERRSSNAPAAQTWAAPNPVASQVGGQPAANPHAANPHAGMGADPHAGMGMGGDPHAGLNMNDPHAGMAMDPHGGEDPAMAAIQPPDPNRSIDPSKFLRGSIDVTDRTRRLVEAGAILFLSAKPYDPGTGEVLGAPLAVDRIDVKSLPIQFELTEVHMMAAGTQFAGDVIIHAHVDQDGEARTDEPGDVHGTVKATIPAKGIKLTLDRVTQ